MFGAAFSVPERTDFEYFFIVDGDQRTSPFALKASEKANLYHFEALPRAVLGFGTSLGPMRRLLNQLHVTMAQNGFTHADAIAVGEDVIMVSRYNIVARQTYVLIAREALNEDVTPCTVYLPGRVTEFLFVAELLPDSLRTIEEEGVLGTEKGKLVFSPDIGRLGVIREE